MAYGLPAIPGFSDWIAPRRNMLAGLGAGLLNGNPGAGVIEGRQADDAYATQQKQEAERQAEIAKAAERTNATVEYFKSKGYDDLVAAAAGGAPMGNLWTEAINRGQPVAPPGPIKASAGDVFLDPKTYQPIATIPDPQAQIDATKSDFANEKDLYAQYSNADPVKTYETVKGAFERVRQSAALDSGAGDMGLIYGYMKMLDPGSVVRESEFAMAAQTGSYGEQIQGLVQRVLTGERLTPSQREAFAAAAAKLYEESAANLSQANDQFGQRASRYGVDPSSILRQPEQFQPIANIYEKYGLER